MRERPEWNFFSQAWIWHCDQPGQWGRCTEQFITATRPGLWVARWWHNRRVHRDQNQG